MWVNWWLLLDCRIKTFKTLLECSKAEGGKRHALWCWTGIMVSSQNKASPFLTLRHFLTPWLTRVFVCVSILLCVPTTTTVRCILWRHFLPKLNHLLGVGGVVVHIPQYYLFGFVHRGFGLPGERRLWSITGLKVGPAIMFNVQLCCENVRSQKTMCLRIPHLTNLYSDTES